MRKTHENKEASRMALHISQSFSRQLLYEQLHTEVENIYSLKMRKGIPLTKGEINKIDTLSIINTYYSPEQWIV
jgi:hypothetical protein